MASTSKVPVNFRDVLKSFFVKFRAALNDSGGTAAAPALPPELAAMGCSDSESCNPDGDTIIHVIVKGGGPFLLFHYIRTYVVAELANSTNVGKKIGAIDALDRFGRSPLFVATDLGLTEVVVVLLFFTTFSLENQYHQSVLRCAAAKGHLAIVVALLHHPECRINKYSSQGDPISGGDALTLAAMYDKAAVCVVLLNREVRGGYFVTDSTELCGKKSYDWWVMNRYARAAQEGYSRIVPSAIDPVYYLGEKTPLHIAAQAGFVDVVNALLTKQRMYVDRRSGLAKIGMIGGSCQLKDEQSFNLGISRKTQLAIQTAFREVDRYIERYRELAEQAQLIHPDCFLVPSMTESERNRMLSLEREAMMETITHRNGTYHYLPRGTALTPSPFEIQQHNRTYVKWYDKNLKLPDFLTPIDKLVWPWNVFVTEVKPIVLYNSIAPPLYRPPSDTAIVIRHHKSVEIDAAYDHNTALESVFAIYPLTIGQIRTIQTLIAYGADTNILRFSKQTFDSYGPLVFESHEMFAQGTEIRSRSIDEYFRMYLLLHSGRCSINWGSGLRQRTRSERTSEIERRIADDRKFAFSQFGDTLMNKNGFDYVASVDRCSLERLLGPSERTIVRCFTTLPLELVSIIVQYCPLPDAWELLLFDQCRHMIRKYGENQNTRYIDTNSAISKRLLFGANMLLLSQMLEDVLTELWELATPVSSTPVSSTPVSSTLPSSTLPSSTLPSSTLPSSTLPRLSTHGFRTKPEFSGIGRFVFFDWPNIIDKPACVTEHQAKLLKRVTEWNANLVESSMGKTSENDPTAEEVVEYRHRTYLSMIVNDSDVRRRLLGPDIGMPPDLLGRLVKFGKLIEVYAEFRESRGTMDFFDIQTPGDLAVVVGQLIEWVRGFEPQPTAVTAAVTAAVTTTMTESVATAVTTTMTESVATAVTAAVTTAVTESVATAATAAVTAAVTESVATAATAAVTAAVTESVATAATTTATAVSSENLTVDEWFDAVTEL
jgi:ankyrin repeat protein